MRFSVRIANAEELELILNLFNLDVRGRGYSYIFPDNLRIDTDVGTWRWGSTNTHFENIGEILEIMNSDIEVLANARV